MYVISANRTLITQLKTQVCFLKPILKLGFFVIPAKMYEQLDICIRLIKDLIISYNLKLNKGFENRMNYFKYYSIDVFLFKQIL